MPQIDPSEWSLRIHGLVEEEVVLRWDDLVALPQRETVATLVCVSNVVGGDLIGTARWWGVPIRDLLARARSGKASSVAPRIPASFCIEETERRSQRHPG